MTNTTQPQGPQENQPDDEATETFQSFLHHLGDSTNPTPLHEVDEESAEAIEEARGRQIDDRQDKPALSPKMTFDELAGIRLKYLRLDAGMTTQAMVADALRDEAGLVLSDSSVSLYELGKHRWTIDDLMAVCITFDVTLDQLVLPPDEEEYDESWFKLIGRPENEDGLWVTGVYAHSIESPQGDFVPVVRRRADLSARLFGVMPKTLENIRKQPTSVHVAELERLNELQDTIDQSKAFHLAQLQSEGDA